jgi:hypothetical protein
MPGKFVAVLGLSLVALLGGCENEATRSETTAPESSEPTASPVSAAGAATFHFKSRGPVASVFIFGDDPEGALIGDVQVQRSESKTGTETFLFYSLQRCHHQTGECVFLELGFGLIPNSQFVAGRGKARLRTNTRASANPTFVREVGSGGPITVEWTETSGFITDFHGNSRTRFPGFSMEHSQFASTTSSALAEGTFMGVEVSPANSNGTIGRARFGSIFIVK